MHAVTFHIFPFIMVQMASASRIVAAQLLSHDRPICSSCAPNSSPSPVSTSSCKAHYSSKRLQHQVQKLRSNYGQLRHERTPAGVGICRGSDLQLVLFSLQYCSRNTTRSRVYQNLHLLTSRAPSPRLPCTVDAELARPGSAVRSFSLGGAHRYLNLTQVRITTSAGLPMADQPFLLCTGRAPKGPRMNIDGGCTTNTNCASHISPLSVSPACMAFGSHRCVSLQGPSQAWPVKAHSAALAHPSVQLGTAWHMHDSQNLMPGSHTR